MGRTVGTSRAPKYLSNFVGYRFSATSECLNFDMFLATLCMMRVMQVPMRGSYSCLNWMLAARGEHRASVPVLVFARGALRPVLCSIHSAYS